jgi:hypothetical protein
LLVDELTLFVDNKVWVQRALITPVVLITLRSAAYSWKCDTAEAGAHRKVLNMTAVSALNVKACSLGGECAGADDDAGYANEVGYICRGETTNGGLRD